ncbi:MAG: GcrA cell cycle regulator [Alphaproteobacteria bacterium]|nr:GcrA cell cycle regulator [Alphaproteobacteria bacterium]MBN9495384.1 GcrA cell cycle regulator [Alphaproteobacteria bacterium]
MDWTPEQISELTRLWGEGLTTAEIGKRLGISKNAVVGKAHRLHLPARPSPIKRTGPRPQVFRQTATVRPSAPRIAAPRPAPAAQAPTSAQALRALANQPSAKRLPMMALNSSTCRWPIGDPGDAEFHFCGEKAEDGKPYCTAHASIAYVKVKPRTVAA